MRLSSFLQLFYLYQFLHDFILIYAVDKLFFAQNGLNITNISVLLSIWAVTSLVLEVPTGVLADRWNRKYMLILGGLFYAICYSIWLANPTFIGFLIGFIFRSLASTFSSGTLQAYIYDFLFEHKKQNLFERVWGKGRAFNLAGLSLGWVFGGIVSEHSYWWVLALSSVAGILSSSIVLFFPNTKNHIAIEESSPFAFLGKSLRYAFTHPALINAFLFTAIVNSSYQVLDEYWSTYFHWLGIPNHAFGILVAVASICGGLAGMFAHNLKKSSRSTLYKATLFMSTVLLAATFFKSYIVVIFLLSFEVVVSITSVLIEGIIQKNANNHQRATLSSVNSMLKEVAVITGLIFGSVADKYGIQYGYGFFGLFILLYFVVGKLTNSGRKEINSATRV